MPSDSTQTYAQGEIVFDGENDEAVIAFVGPRVHVIAEAKDVVVVDRNYLLQHSEEVLEICARIEMAKGLSREDVERRLSDYRRD